RPRLRPLPPPVGAGTGARTADRRDDRAAAAAPAHLAVADARADPAAADEPGSRLPRPGRAAMIRPTGPRVFGVLVALALVGYTFVLAPRLALSSGTGTAAGPLFPTPDGGTSANDAPTYFPA